jgi:hypothetical protein
MAKKPKTKRREPGSSEEKIYDWTISAFGCSRSKPDGAAPDMEPQDADLRVPDPETTEQPRCRSLGSGPKRAKTFGELCPPDILEQFTQELREAAKEYQESLPEDEEMGPAVTHRGTASVTVLGSPVHDPFDELFETEEEEEDVIEPWEAWMVGEKQTLIIRRCTSPGNRGEKELLGLIQRILRPVRVLWPGENGIASQVVRTLRMLVVEVGGKRLLAERFEGLTENYYVTLPYGAKPPRDLEPCRHDWMQFPKDHFKYPEITHSCPICGEAKREVR